jgi:ABC-2 type transport system ATP-binding protein
VGPDVVIATRGLTKDFGEGRGLFALDLEVERGEIFGFLGPNGAGKSTTMRLLLDLIRPTSGSATVLGLDSHRDALEIHRRVGFLPGDFTLYPKLTGQEVLDFFAALHGGVDPRVRQDLVDRFDAQVDRPVRELSTGNRQKLGLVQAFMHEPECLILDEPIAGLDPLVQHSFHDLLAQIVTEGRTVFLSSHTLSEVERVAQRVAILRRGRLVVTDTFEALRRVALHTLEVEFAETPPTVDALRAVAGVHDVRSVDSRYEVDFAGSADPVVKFLAGFDVRSVRSVEADLEEVFLRFYRDEPSA